MNKLQLFLFVAFIWFPCFIFGAYIIFVPRSLSTQKKLLILFFILLFLIACNYHLRSSLIPYYTLPNKAKRILKQCQILKNDEKCPICLGSSLEKRVYLPCNHTFHYQCIVTWFHYKIWCPLCNQPIEENEL